MQTDIDRQATKAMDEALKIAQAIVLTAIFVAAGKVFASPLAYAAGGAIYLITCLYVGVRTDSLVAWARYPKEPRRFTKWDRFLGAAASVAFAAWLFQVLQAVLQHEGFF